MASMFANLIRGKLPSYTRKGRHLHMLRHYGSPSKLLNLARAELSRVRGDIVLRSRPYIYTIDTGNVCNLRCPLCPTGYNGLERPQGLMSMKTFEIVLEQIRPYAIEAVLHNWGEPLLNPNILDMIRASRAAGVGTAISSNLNLVRRGEDFLREVVDSGLDHLTMSVDGTTQEVYEKYRRGGDLEHVFRNLKALLSYRRESGRETPIIEWQFLVMRQNEHQMGEARRLAEEYGVDRLRFTGAGLPFDELANVNLGEVWLPENANYCGYDPAKIRSQGYLYDEKCFYLYRAMTVNPKGEVSPCCAIYHSKYDFGNLLESKLDSIWNNPHYRSARALFSKRGEEGSCETVCHRCPLFKYETNDAR